MLVHPSPVLFTIHLEHALKEVRTVLGKPKSSLEEKISREIAYADDVDFVGLEYIDKDAVQRTLHRYNLKVNIEKTEKKTSLIKNEDAWRSTKKVGSLMDDKEDVQRRKQLSNAALCKLKNIWIGKDKINHNIKIKLYKALVKSILTYNCGTWALAQTELNKLDAFHRKQLRKVFNIYYSTKISNKTLYKKCNEKPLSTHISEVVGAFSDIACVEMRRYLPTKPWNYISTAPKKDSGEDQLQPCQ